MRTKKTLRKSAIAMAIAAGVLVPASAATGDPCDPASTNESCGVATEGGTPTTSERPNEQGATASAGGSLSADSAMSARPNE